MENYIEVVAMAKWICTSCSYVHDDRIENPYEDELLELGKAGGDWNCPLCGATKDYFVEMA